MKKYLLFATLVAFAGSSAGANDMDRSARKAEWKASLTEHQMECLTQHNCPRMSAGERRYATEAQRTASRECQKRAIEACGIEKPANMNKEGKTRDRAARN